MSERTEKYRDIMRRYREGVIGFGRKDAKHLYLDQILTLAGEPNLLYFMAYDELTELIEESDNTQFKAALTRERDRRYPLDAVHRLLALIDRHLEVWSVGDDICVSYENCEVKGYGVLISEYGVGSTFESACEDYLRKISGKTLVFNACTESRKEITVL